MSSHFFVTFQKANPALPDGINQYTISRLWVSKPNSAKYPSDLIPIGAPSILIDL